MKTPDGLSALGKLALVLAAMSLAAGCGGGPGTGSAHSPSAAAGFPSPSADSTPSPSPDASPSPTASASPSPVPSPVPVAGAFGVLVSPLAGQPSYSVSLVATNGAVVASAGAATPNPVACGSTAAGVVPLPVSTSNTRAYFMDTFGVVRFVSPSGQTGVVTTLPAASGRRSLFAVSPDDRRIAVAVVDFKAGGASTTLYVEDLNGGGNRVAPYSLTGSYTIWPIGWHGTNNLVVAKVPACTQGGGFGCCGPQELHAVDPATFSRKFIFGGAGCLISGPPSAGGVSCETSASTDYVFGWTNLLLRTYAIAGGGMGPIYISPDGKHLALSTNPGVTTVEGASTLSMDVCGWIDATHVIAGGDTQQQPRVGDIGSGNIVPVAARGDCGGRIPGGL